MAKVVAVVQARIGSSRLRGKVLADLNGRTVLAHVLGRAAAIPGVDEVCCAIPDTPENSPVAVEAERAEATVFLGSEADVLLRYAGAARATGADVVIRITSDCPLLDPEVSGAVLRQALAHQADYASNVDPRSWPKGLDTEVISIGALERAHAEASSPYDREHVTPWLRQNPSVPQVNVSKGGESCADLRWTLDYPEDLAFMRAVHRHLADMAMLRFQDVLAVINRHPELTAINSHLG